MVKLVAFLKRKKGTTREQFYEHWYDVHAPLILGTPELARHIVRYEQLPVDFGTEGYDGITIHWLESAASFEAFVNEPKYSELVHPDEKSFLDVEGIVWMVTGEPRVPLDGPV